MSISTEITRFWTETPTLSCKLLSRLALASSWIILFDAQLNLAAVEEVPANKDDLRSVMSALVKPEAVPEDDDLGPIIDQQETKVPELVGCDRWESLVNLRSSIDTIVKADAGLGGDPLQAASNVLNDLDENPEMSRDCPGGVVTALTYTSISQELDVKYSLLYKATYFLFSQPDRSNSEVGGVGGSQQFQWPVKDELIRTLYANSERQAKKPIIIPKKIRLPLGTDISDAMSRNIANRNTVTVHFKSIMLYYFYEPGSQSQLADSTSTNTQPENGSPCICHSNSWCVAQWFRALTNKTIDIWMAGRDANRTVYKVDDNGCAISMNQGLAQFNMLDIPIDILFIFEVNSFMHPEARGGINAKRTILYPTYNLSPEQMKNFDKHKISILRDDQVLKPPNVKHREVLEETYSGNFTEVVETDREALEEIYGRGAINASLQARARAIQEAQKKEGSDKFNESAFNMSWLNSLNESVVQPSRSFEFPRSEVSRKTLVYPAGIRPTKGQLALVELLMNIEPDSYEAEQLQGLHIYFAGACTGNTTYCSQLVQRCAQMQGKGLISCTLLGQITKRELALVYRSTDGSILYTNNDCNPRVIYESLIMNKPFFSTHEAQIPELLHNVGHVVKFGDEDVLEELGLFLNALKRNMWGNRPRQMAQEKFVERDVYKSMLEFVETAFWTWTQR